MRAEPAVQLGHALSNNDRHPTIGDVVIMIDEVTAPASAARGVCGPVNFTGCRNVSQHWKGCVSNSARNAVFAANEAALTAYYADALRAPVSRSAG